LLDKSDGHQNGISGYDLRSMLDSPQAIKVVLLMGCLVMIIASMKNMTEDNRQGVKSKFLNLHEYDG